MRKVEIYTKAFCPYCTRAIALLNVKGIRFTEIKAVKGVNYDAVRAEMVERSLGLTTFPQIFIGNTHVGGSDDLAALNNRGELLKLIGKE